MKLDKYIKSRYVIKLGYNNSPSSIGLAQQLAYESTDIEETIGQLLIFLKENNCVDFYIYYHYATSICLIRKGISRYAHNFSCDRDVIRGIINNLKIRVLSDEYKTFETQIEEYFYEDL